MGGGEIKRTGEIQKRLGAKKFGTGRKREKNKTTRRDRHHHPLKYRHFPSGLAALSAPHLPYQFCNILPSGKKKKT
jgi:hypothetical protein